jgi:hypothetical protein
MRVFARVYDGAAARKNNLRIYWVEYDRYPTQIKQE